MFWPISCGCWDNTDLHLRKCLVEVSKLHSCCPRLLFLLQWISSGSWGRKGVWECSEQPNMERKLPDFLCCFTRSSSLSLWPHYHIYQPAKIQKYSSVFWRNLSQSVFRAWKWFFIPRIFQLPTRACKLENLTIHGIMLITILLSAW